MAEAGRKKGKKEIRVPLTASAGAISVLTAALLRIFGEQSSPYLRLIGACVFFLSFLAVYLAVRPVKKVKFSGSGRKETVGAIFAFTAALLTALPLLLLGDSVGMLASYRAYTPFPSEGGGGLLQNLLLGTLLPMLLFTLGECGFCLCCLTPPEGEKGVTARSELLPPILCGGLYALSFGEPLRLPCFLLMGAAFAYLTHLADSIRLPLLFSLFFGLLLHLYEGYIALFGSGAYPETAQIVGMGMIFSAVALPLWRLGVRWMKGAPRPGGMAFWLPLLISAVLLISGCAVTGYTG